MRIEDSKLRFLLPGLRIKRFIFVIILGILLIIYSVFLLSVAISGSEYLSQNALYIGKYFDSVFKSAIVEVISVLLILLSAFLIYFGISSLLKSVSTALMPEKSYDEAMSILFERRKENLKKKVVNIGGGTGTTAVLEGLRGKFLKISAIITVADSGGSSGRIRKELKVPPPGDIRNCLISLTEENSFARKILSYRFSAPNSCFDGHNLGNILIAGFTKVTGDFAEAVLKLGKFLQIDGEVLPFTEDEAVLCAEFEDGVIIEGESDIAERGGKIKRVFLKDGQIKPSLPALQRIIEADIIIIGPGSLYTSIMPPLLLPTIADTIRRSKAIKVYVVNVMTEHGETDGFTASDHVREIVSVLGENVLDYAIVNNRTFSEKVLQKYAESHSFPVEIDKENIEKLGVRTIIGDFAEERGGLIRHNSDALREAIVKLKRRKA